MKPRTTHFTGVLKCRGPCTPSREACLNMVLAGNCDKAKMAATVLHLRGISAGVVVDV